MKRIKSLIVFVVSRTDSCVSVRMSAQYLIRVILFIGFHTGVAYSDGNNNNNVIRVETANAIHLSADNVLVVPSDIIVVELNVYSGEDDPFVQIPRAQIQPMLQSSFGWRNPGVPSGVGYKGFTLYNYEPNPIRIGCGSDMGVETGLLQRMGLRIDPTLRQTVQSQMQAGWSLHQSMHHGHRPHPGMPHQGIFCPRPPSSSTYEPHVWNNRTFVQRRNNCYNYASNIITNTFAQPGRANRHNITRNPPQLYGESVYYGAILDGLIPVPAPTQCLPSPGLNLIALVIWPGRDYHFYRLDKNGYFSHKPGRSPARNVDNSNNLILDPRTCDRGPYTVFKGFFTTNIFNVRHLM